MTTIATAEQEDAVKRTKPAPKPPVSKKAPKRVATVAHPSTKEIDEYVASQPKAKAAAKKPTQIARRAELGISKQKAAAKQKPAAVAKAAKCGERGCQEPVVRRALCRKHYRAWLTTSRELVA